MSTIDKLVQSVLIEIELKQIANAKERIRANRLKIRETLKQYGK